MDRTRKTLEIPGVAVIVRLNRLFIERSGEEFIGEDNLIFRPALEYILDAIRAMPFGEDRFPTIFHKAAAIAECIIVKHTFYGANKRTGLATCAAFLVLNGYEMRICDEERFDEDAIETVLRLQEKEMPYEDFVRWVESRCV
ncbi:MAG: type II toxin-antitoxin system death-on-curing family toxin [Armatimonadetes bacterium]|nr:type II toxin-antitoxin system death-on-curing family toxin [Armatimonadota bacterium]